jgi:deoxyribonuclease IV
MVKLKLKLGYGVGLPLDYQEDVPEYTTDNIKLIHKLSKKFDCIQVMFTKSKLTSEEIIEIKNIIKDYNTIFIHANYQINMGADLIPSQTDLYNTGIEIFLNEIIWATKINSTGIVVHMGKNVSNRYDHIHIYNNMVKFIVELFKKLKSKNIILPILLETPAGQGGEMCWNLEEFVEFITRFNTQSFYSQLGVCIDTCHIFQAGYDLNDSKEIKRIHKILKPIKDKIKLIHLNDSYHPVGERIDRHEQIGQGHIQTDKLIEFIFPYKSIPMILETTGPYDKQIENLTK